MVIGPKASRHALMGESVAEYMNHNILLIIMMNHPGYSIRLMSMIMPKYILIMCDPLAPTRRKVCIILPCIKVLCQVPFT